MKRKRTLFLFCAAFALLILSGLGWLAARGRLARASLQVEARVSDNHAEQRPASGATLYLLNQDMMRLALKEEGERSPPEEKAFRENPELRRLAGLMNARRREAYSLGPEISAFVEKSKPLWQPHVIQTAQTDGQGRAHFYNLKPGDYWLMCLTGTGDDGVAFWNLSVTLKNGENTLRLDPLNALQCTACR
jgi:hypothetical protein